MMFSIKNVFISIIKKHKYLSIFCLYLIPDWHITINMPYIGKFRIRLRRNRSFWLRDPLQLEMYPLSVLKAIVRPGDVVWDVGANIGLYSRWLVNHLLVSKVIAFEPMTENLPELIYNLNLGNIGNNVFVFPWAISDIDGPIEFQVDNIQSASGAIDSICQGNPSRARSALGLKSITEKVSSRTIDSIINSGEVEIPDVLKIDIEGAEYLLLKGGESFFTKYSPLILIETHGLEVSKQCISFLFDHGYNVAACVPESKNSTRHQQIFLDYILTMNDQYDAHFLVASKNIKNLPITLNIKYI